MKAPILFIRALGLSALVVILLSTSFVLAQTGDGSQPPPTTPATSDPNANGPIDPNSLTPENGWVCDANKASCHNTATEGFHKGATANCTGTGASQACIQHLPELQQFLEDRCATGSLWDGFKCNITAPFRAVANAGYSLLRDTALAILTGVAFIILMFANLLLGISGTLFNWVVVKTVFEFSSLIGNSAGLLTAWRILRDLGNMLLLFGFIFIGIAMILDLHSYPARKTLPKLIIFAVLMNFSLFAAEAVIDVSNGLSSVFYSQANVNPCNGIVIGNSTSVAGTASDSNLEASQANLEDCSVNYGIAGHIMQSTGLSSIFSVNSFPSESQTVVVYLGLALFATIGAVVLFSASIMLIVRAVTLTMLMVVAPLGFAGMAIPPLQAQAMKWWKTLLAQSFFVPVLLLLIFVSLKIVDGFSSLDSQSHSLAGALTEPSVSNVGIILVFTLVIGFLVASLLAAKKFGAAGADAAIKLGTSFAFGGTARGTNLALGGIGYGLQRLQQKTGAGGQAGRYVASRGFQRLARANFDMRRLPGMSAGLGMLAGAAAKPSTGTSFTDMRHQYQDFRAGEAGKKLDAEYDRQVATDSLIQELRGGLGLSPESERFLASLSADEIASNHDLQHNIEALADRLSPDQFDGMMKSDKLTQNTKNELSSARFGDVRSALAGGAGYANRDVVRSMSNKDIEAIAKYDPGLFNDLIAIQDPATGDGIFSNDQNDHLAKSSSLTNSQRSSARAQTKVGRVEEAVRSGAGARANTVAAGMGSKTKAKLNVSSLTNPDVMATFTTGDLAEIQREAKLSSAEINTIAAAIRNPAHPNHAAIDTWLTGKPDANGYWR